MRTVIQRVKHAEVFIDNETRRTINQGLLLLIGIEEADTIDDIKWLANKILNLRIFDDDNGIMNLDVKQTGGDVMIVSQFTLHAQTRKGNRPSYIRAAKPETAIPLYQDFIKEVEILLKKEIVTGEFGAHMDISLVNNGPVTIIIDTKNKE
jgi:D-tyrosyl-tRNA(Tyr) deacylase